MLFRTLLCLLAIPSATSAATYYVNNQVGDDHNAGTTADAPLASVTHAVSLCKTSDALVLANTGKPYYESLNLGRLGGTPQRPFVIEGNGAVLSGLIIIEPARWKKLEDDLYLLPLDEHPYGNPFLVNRDQRLKAAKKSESLASEEHFWDREAGVYFRCAPGKDLESYELAATLNVSGLITTSASYVVCRNLVCEHFSNDGFNMHGDCRGIYLENVVARHNGDDGISIHESGGLVVRNAYVHHNTYGLQDVNASRSFYNGVIAEDNLVGASFHGGFHSLVDCVISGSETDQIDVVADTPKHLIGAEHNPICRATLFAKNVVLLGNRNRAGIRVRDHAHAVVENSLIVGSLEGIHVHPQGQCHLTTSVIAECDMSINSETVNVFRDYNLYHPGQMAWLGTDYPPEQWDAFRAEARFDEHSRIAPVNITDDNRVELPPDLKMEKRVGPTQQMRHEFIGPAGQ